MVRPAQDSRERPIPVRRRAGVALAALLVGAGPALAAHGASTPTPPAAPGTPAPSTAAPGQVPSGTTFAPAVVPGAVTAPPATAITPQNRFAVQVDPTGRQSMDATWPSAATLFTAGELRQVLPEVRAVEAVDCTSGRLPAGGRTTKPARCTLELTTEPGSAVPDRIMVDIRSFGTPAQVGTHWQQTLARARIAAAERPGLYTFWNNGSFGTSAILTDGTTTRVLVQRAGVAGEIWFSGIGFTDLKPSYTASRQDYRMRVAPALARLLATKLAPAA